MPHKHKRKRGDDADFNLPPSQRALPLPVNSKKAVASHGTSRQAKKRRLAKSDSDAPRAFQRLMAFSSGKKIHSGLEDRKGEKSTTAELKQRGESLQIKSGEDLRAFAARVDAAMPLAGVSTKSGIKGKDLDGIKTQKTRKERKMHKLYDQWREEERKIQEQREEEKELAAERELENDGAGILSISVLDDEGGTRKKKKGKRGKDIIQDDPWADLKKKRGEAKRGLNDVVEAPPELHKKQSRLLKVVGTATVNVGSAPKAAGSLRRREQLEEERQDVVEAYRRIREHEQRKLDSRSM
ncbi:hypothetical protein V2A60_004612 [Cordyceps javanica]